MSVRLQLRLWVGGHQMHSRRSRRYYPLSSPISNGLRHMRDKDFGAAGEIGNCPCHTADAALMRRGEPKYGPYLNRDGDGLQRELRQR